MVVVVTGAVVGPSTYDENDKNVVINPIRPGLFGSIGTRGGADLPPPNKNGGNGWGVQKLSWNLRSYQD